MHSEPIYGLLHIKAVTFMGYNAFIFYFNIKVQHMVTVCIV